MILIGRYLSPFVRRAATTLHLYGIPYEHHPLQHTGDAAAELRTRNPVGRVPALIIDDGQVLVDSSTIIDYLDQATADIDTTINRAEREIELLNEYRTRLIADVVTGKLDVRDSAAALPEVDPLAEADDADDLDVGLDMDADLSLIHI